MAVTNYRIYKSLDASGEHLTFVASAEGSGPASAVRAHYAHGGEDGVPEHLVVIAHSSCHALSAAVETQTRIKLD